MNVLKIATMLLDRTPAVVTVVMLLTWMKELVMVKIKYVFYSYSYCTQN